MASRYAAAASRRNSPIDKPLAAAAALAVGFAAFVMPGDILSSLVQATGLPSVLPMAEPPLGMKARAGISLVAALLTFGSVFLLLRRIGGASAPAPRERDIGGWLPEVDEVRDTSPAAPRLRRADVHPDAPARRPILAVRELGEPAPHPSFVAEMPVEPEAMPEPGPEPEPEPQAVDTIEEPPVAEELDELELTGSDIEMIAPAPEQFVPAPVHEPTEHASVAELMARLELGLARRIRRPEPAPVPAVEAEPEPVRDSEPVPIFQAGGDDRLRSAMENLQRMAARAG